MLLRYIYIPLFVVSSNVFSADIGFDAAVKAGSAIVNDPDGNVAPSTALSPALDMYFSTGRASRMHVGISALSFTSDASAEDLNQDVSGYSLMAGYQKRIAFSRNFKVWFGGALGYSSYEFTNRFSIDDEGFLVDSFDDRTVDAVSFHVSAQKYFEITDSVNFGVGIFSDIGFQDSVSLVGLKFTIGNID